MGNVLSGASADAQGGKPSSARDDRDLSHLARIKRAEDARKEAIAANMHDNKKVLKLRIKV